MMILIIMLTITLIGVIVDIKEKKIPNKITMLLVVVGLVFNCFNKGILNGCIFSLKGIIVAFLLFMVANILIHGIGFGDVKLLMGIGSCMGYVYIINTYIISLFLCLIIRFFINPKNFIKAYKDSIMLIKTTMVLKEANIINNKEFMKSKEGEFLKQKSKEIFIFGIYIFLGCIVTSALEILVNFNLLKFLIG